MRTVQKEYVVYTLGELREVNPKGYERALEQVRDNWYEGTFTYDAEDFRKSMESIAEDLNVSIDLTIDLFGQYNRINVDVTGYMEMENAERNDLVKHYNVIALDEAAGKCSFTGVYTDAMFFDTFRDMISLGAEISYNNFHDVIVDAFEAALAGFRDDALSTWYDETLMEEYYTEMLDTWEFTLDGELFEV